MSIEEYNQAVELYSNQLYRFLLKSLKDREQAKDLVQESYEKLWISIGSVPLEKAKSFLFMVGYRKMIDLIRRDRFVQMEEGERHEPIFFEKEYNNLKEILDNALEKLSPIQKSLVILRDYEEYSYKEIAEITALSEAQVKVYLFRARKFLKEYLVSIKHVRSL